VRIERLSRWSPLTGILFVALVAVGGFGLEGSTPGAGASGAHVIAFYAAHRGRERAGAIVIALALAAFLAFAATLRARWRTAAGTEALAALVLAAATVLATGTAVNASLAYVLTEDPSRMSPATAQTLNLLSNDLLLATAVGAFLFGISAGLAILRGVQLPVWLGWLAFVVAVLFITPAELIGFVLLLVWTVLVSIALIRRAEETASAGLASRAT
jgi:hypothetical protein